MWRNSICDLFQALLIQPYLLQIPKVLCIHTDIRFKLAEEVEDQCENIVGESDNNKKKVSLGVCVQ